MRKIEPAWIAQTNSTRGKNIFEKLNVYLFLPRTGLEEKSNKTGRKALKLPTVRGVSEVLEVNSWYQVLGWRTWWVTKVGWVSCFHPTGNSCFIIGTFFLGPINVMIFYLLEDTKIIMTKSSHIGLIGTPDTQLTHLAHWDIILI